VEGVARSEVANSVSVSALVRGCSSRANFAHHVDAGWVKVWWVCCDAYLISCRSQFPLQRLVPAEQLLVFVLQRLEASGQLLDQLVCLSVVHNC
jgi:hypothetical protein